MSVQRAEPAAIFRSGLWALGGIQAVLGAYALIAPAGFYEDFPLGRGWVSALPAYSEHLVRDVGALFLLSAAVLIAAGAYLERRLVALALGSFLLFSVPHTTFHYLNLEPYETTDIVANAIGLGAQVLLPLALLVLLYRRPAAARAAPARVAEEDRGKG